jgi:CRISPR-associated endonuclease/helicase Cas3
MMPDADDFAEFYSAIHPGRGAFPWQEALARRVVHDRRWPAVIDVPTGLGKTSVLDVAVFLAALGGAPARRRIFYVVDRRLVVDEAYKHAERISQALNDPGANGIVEWVAKQLRPAGNSGAALEVTRMRGGTTWDRTWLERPDQHAIVTGTVDQIGSRLLFRGYGVSEWARSIDAAMAGTDSLIVVDEAHLAGPLLSTIGAALTLDTTRIVPPPILITMSATTSDANADVHHISEADARHPVAGERLRAPKGVRLVEVRTTRSSAPNDVSRAIAAIASEFAGTRVVGVVVNTVGMARHVFELLRPSHETVLLTGASRQVDRDYLLARYYDRVSVDRIGTEKPLIVVATQTIEVGANIDVDVLVTETAPLPSLIQRLGRLNRTARWKIETEPAPAFVVHHSAVTSEDPIYGPARLATFDWLSSRMEVETFSPCFSPLDLSQAIPGSPEALRQLTSAITDDERAAMWPKQRLTPVLFESTLDTWVRTSPAPVPDQPVAPFLHGIADDDQPPVTVAWRADQSLEVPLAAEEGLEVSIAATRRWLRGDMATSDESDVVVPYIQPGGDGTDPKDLRMAGLVLRIRGRSGQPEKIAPHDVRPGDVIVVPASFGGCDEFGWNPASRAPVVDVSDLAMRRGRPILRLGPPLRAAIEWVDSCQEAELTPLVELLLRQARTDVSDGLRTGRTSKYDEILKEMASQTGVTPPLNMLLKALRGVRVTLVAEPDNHDGSAGSTETETHLGLLTAGVTALMDDDTVSGSSAACKRIGLDAHERGVALRAREFAGNLHLSQRLIDTIEFAARWHDEGKRDPRFQIMLWHGDRLAAEIADEPLAKSGMDPADRVARQRAARLSGYPRRMRHEALSARIAAVRPADVDIDRELAIHLVASHHGRARALLPPTHDPAPEKIEVPGHGVFGSGETVDWAQPARFAALNRAYGRWGLALLEAVVRLADIWCSARDESEREVSNDSDAAAARP